MEGNSVPPLNCWPVPLSKSEAIKRGDKKKLLSFNLKEKPLALQIGGSSPKTLGEAAKIGEDFGYDEIN